MQQPSCLTTRKKYSSSCSCACLRDIVARHVFSPLSAPLIEARFTQYGGGCLCGTEQLALIHYTQSGGRRQLMRCTKGIRRKLCSIFRRQDLALGTAEMSCPNLGTVPSETRSVVVVVIEFH